MSGVGGVGYGADIARVGSGAFESQRASGQQTIDQKLDDLTKRYNDISRQLKSLQQRTKPVSTDQKDKLRSLLEDAARLRKNFDEVTSARKNLQDADKTRAETDRLDEFAMFEVLQKKNLENVQSTLVARANTSLNARLQALQEDVQRFVDNGAGKRPDLEQRVAEADKDLDLIQGALDSLARPTDSFITNLTSVQQSSADDSATTLQEIKILLKP